MKAVARYTISFILVSSVVMAYHTSTKLRRDGVLNLYPFPRVGRADSTWGLPYDKSLHPINIPMFPFARVGRSVLRPDVSLQELLLGRHNLYVKRDSYAPRVEADALGMWFGPRLGRGMRNEEDDIPISSQNEIERSEPEQLEETQGHVQ